MTAASTLVTAFEVRYSAHRIKQWTRQDDPANAGTKDSDKLTAAAEDAIEEFTINSGILFDETNNLHVKVGCDIMEWVFSGRALARSASASLDDAVMKRLDKIRKMRARPFRVDANTDARLPTAPAASQTPDTDADGSFWVDFEPGRNQSTVKLDETNPFG